MATKVGVITISLRWLLLNFGTFFQHYALRRALIELGCVPFRVDYDSPSEDFDGRTCNLRAFCAVFWHWLRWGKSLSEELSHFLYYRQRIRRAFLEYKKFIGAIHEVQIDDPEMIVVGGDQVLTSRDKKYFGAMFLSKKIAYSASADWVRVSRDYDWCKTAREQFALFDSVGIREMRGVELVNEICHAVNAVFMPDPVFLLPRDEYSGLVSCRRIFNKPTLLVHVVNWYEKQDSYVDKLAVLADRLEARLRIVASQGCERYVPFRYSYHIGPSDYLRAIRDAEYVVTNSFHGIVFCLLFNKQFIFIQQRNLSGTNQNERQETILKDFDLADRVFNSSDNVYEYEKKLCQHVGFEKVNEKINECRKIGLSFLKTEISRCK